MSQNKNMMEDKCVMLKNLKMDICSWERNVTNIFCSDNKETGHTGCYKVYWGDFLLLFFLNDLKYSQMIQAEERDEWIYACANYAGFP